MLYQDGSLYQEYEAEKEANPNGILHRRFNRIQTVLKPIQKKEELDDWEH